MRSKKEKVKLKIKKFLLFPSYFLLFTFYFLLLTLLPLSSYATTEYQANFSFEVLDFLLNRDDHKINDQLTLDADFKFVWDNQKNLKINLHPRLRIDFLDTSRNRYIPNEAYLKYYTGNFESALGLQLIHWGSSTFYNPTNILNRRDLEDNYYSPERLGELMLHFQYVIPEWGPLKELTFQTFFLPLFQEAPLPENDTRFAIAGNAGIIPYTLFDTQDAPEYPEAMGGALKIAATIGSWDLSLHYYHGPEREPGYVLITDNTGALRAQAFYYILDMIGGNIETTWGNAVLHLEAAYKITDLNDARNHIINFENNNAIPESYFQFVPGVDYTVRDLFKKGDLLLTLEYMGDSEQDDNLRNFRPFQNDLFFGLQYHFSNKLQSMVSFGTVQDLGQIESVYIFSLSSKIYKELKLAFEGVMVNQNGNQNTPLSFFDNNSHIMTRLSYSFGGKK